MFLLCLGLWEVLLQVSGRSPLHMSVTVLFCLDSWEIRSLDPDAISEILPLTVERLIGVPHTPHSDVLDRVVGVVSDDSLRAVEADDA